jgi:crotonobetainyl-CoA:carnitine CoA-transferase CaiB-like acyl-CoA transferase
MKKPLSGIRIIDFTKLLPGPMCTLHLADMGAEVIRIEDVASPNGGDMTRELPPGVTNRRAPMFLPLNRNKKSVALDLRTQEGLQVLKDLCATADVFVEGFRPGVAKKLGFDYDTIKAVQPAIVYCSISGYGQDGPMALMGGHDINYQALSGILEQTALKGGQPIPGGFQAADLAGGSLTAAMSICAALVDAKLNQQGRYLDVSMTDSLLSLSLMNLAAWQMAGKPPAAGTTTLTGGIAAYQTYPTADGRWLAVGAIEFKFWKNFCETIGRIDLLAKGHLYGQSSDAVVADIASVIKTKTLGEWTEIFKNVDACVTPVLNIQEVAEQSLTKDRGMFVESVDDLGHPYKQFAFPVKMSSYEFELERQAPELGADTADLLKQLGYTENRLAELKSAGVI